MKNFVASLSAWFLICTLLIPARDLSSAEPKESYTDADLNLVVEAMKPSVQVLKQPLYTYHWTRSSSWQKEISAADSSGLNYAKSGSEGYWRQNSGSGGNYGYGLYTAEDPVATKSFGGFYNYPQSPGMPPTTPQPDPTDWILLQLKYPSGFRYFDMRTAQATNPELRAALARMGCAKATLTPPPGMPPGTMMPDNPFDEAIVKGGGSSWDSTPEKASCHKAMKKIFNDILKLDAFAYSYSGSNLPDCEREVRMPGSAAWVITSNKWITADQIRLFNKSTKDAIPDRARIQELFHRASDPWQDPNQNMALKMYKDYFKKEPDLEKPVNMKAFYEVANEFFKSNPSAMAYSGNFASYLATQETFDKYMDEMIASMASYVSSASYASYWGGYGSYASSASYASYMVHAQEAMTAILRVKTAPFWRFIKDTLSYQFPNLQSRKEVEDLLKSSKATRPPRVRNGEKLWADSDQLKVDEAAVTHWMRKNLFECGKDRQSVSLKDLEATEKSKCEAESDTGVEDFSKSVESCLKKLH